MAVRHGTSGRPVEIRPGERAHEFSDGRFTVGSLGPGTALAIGPDLVVVIMGRIDELPGVPLSTTKDNVADLVLRRWRRVGPRMLQGSSGDFMLLCYDRRSGALSVFRDIVGAVPVYLVGGDRQIVTTSLGAALSAATPATPDWRWTQAYLDGIWPEAHLTPYEEIQLLPPGWLATLHEGSAWHSRRLDEWQWVEDVPGELSASADRFRTLFDQAVTRRLKDVPGPVAVTTSGGLDSSSVLVTAQDVAPDRPLVALALAFTDRRGDERAYQEAVAAQAGVRLEWVSAHQTSGPFGDGPDAVIEEHSGPPLVGNWFLHAALRQRAKELGVVRVLDGEDGDGVVGGNPLYLADLLGRGRLVRWLCETVSLARALEVDAVQVARRSLRQARDAARRHQLGTLFDDSVRGLVRGGYLSCITAETHRMWEGLPAGIAHPFLDRQVMEYAIAVPRCQRIDRGVSKILLRRAMADRLPAAVAGRTDKANISHPFTAALRGEQWVPLSEGLRLAEDVLGRARVPVVDRGSSPGLLYRAYRFACVAYWISRNGRVARDFPA